MLLSLVATHSPAWSGVITILNTGLVSRHTSVCLSVARRSVRYTAASLPLLTTWVKLSLVCSAQTPSEGQREGAIHLCGPRL